MRILDQALEKLKIDVAQAQEECRKKQEKLDEIARLTGTDKEEARPISTSCTE